MSRLTKKWFKDFLFSNLDDTEVSNPGVDQVPYFDTVSSKWKNGDTSNVLLLTPNVLSRELFVPAGKTGIMNSFRSNGFRIRAEGRLRVL